MSAAPSRFGGGSALERLGVRTGITGPPALAQAQRIRLDLIDEDPDQPRKTFDEAELQSLADSIRDRGVLQPVSVEAQPGGRYLLRMGGRRFRAAGMVGLMDIPAVLVAPGSGGLLDQVTENAQRASNTDSEIADAIATLTAEGRTNEQIAAAVGVSGGQEIKFYRVLAKVREVAALAPWIDRASARTLYELHVAMLKMTDTQRQRVEVALAGLDDLTLTDARRIAVAAKADKAAVAVSDPSPPAEMASVMKTTGSPARKVENAPSKGAARADPDAEREALVRAWLADRTRPRPPLAV